MKGAFKLDSNIFTQAVSHSYIMYYLNLNNDIYKGLNNLQTSSHDKHWWHEK